MRRLTQAIQQKAQGAVDEIRQAFRGILHLVKSADNIQKVQASGLADETLQDVELMQQFGFTSVHPANTQALILPIGEVAVYDESGSSIVLKKGRLIEIDCDVLKINATKKVDISSPLVETDRVFTAQGQINGNGGMAVQGGSGASFTGNVKQSGGSFTTNGDVKAGTISLSNHKHTGDSGGKTSKPE